MKFFLLFVITIQAVLAIPIPDASPGTSISPDGTRVTRRDRDFASPDGTRVTKRGDSVTPDGTRVTRKD